MSELALRRLLVRSRRRRPRPSQWWLCVVMLAAFALLSVLAAVAGAWLSFAADTCNGVVWWKALHSPPRYWNQRAFWLWWPPGMGLAVAGVIW